MEKTTSNEVKPLSINIIIDLVLRKLVTEHEQAQMDFVNHIDVHLPYSYSGKLITAMVKHASEVDYSQAEILQALLFKANSSQVTLYFLKKDTHEKAWMIPLVPVEVDAESGQELKHPLDFLESKETELQTKFSIPSAFAHEKEPLQDATLYISVSSSHAHFLKEKWLCSLNQYSKES